MKLNICIIGAHIPPVMGGIETHMWGLSKHLAARGHSVFLIGHTEDAPLNNLPAYEEIDSVKINRVGYVKGIRRLSRALNIIYKTLSLHKKHRFDVIHCHYLYPTCLVGAILNILTGVKLIATEHGSIIDESKTWWKRVLINLAATKTRKVLTTSRELADICTSSGIKREKVANLPNAVDCNRFVPNGDVGGIRKQYNIAESDVLVLALRRIVPKTGIQYLIEAAKHVAEKIGNIKFMVVGKAVNEEFFRKIKDRISQLNLEKHFVFAGSVDNDKVPQYVCASDIAVFPSLAEATSIACLEVMACGKPVVASSVGGLPEIIEDGVNGLLVDFGKTSSSYSDWGVPENAIMKLADAVIKLAQNKNLRDKLGSAARTSVRKNFSWDKYVKKMEEIYNATPNPAYAVRPGQTAIRDCPRVALVHDWLTGMRGGEKVLEALCEIYPQADIFTLLWNKGSVSKTIEGHKIHTSFIQHLPFAPTKYRYYLPLMPQAILGFNFEKYDLVISTSHCVAKSARVTGKTPHICYCFSPMRYIWDQYEEYFNPERSGFIVRSIMSMLRPHLQKWDRETSSRVSEFITISQHIRNKLKNCYGRDSEVVYPPVDIDGFQPVWDGGYFLIVTAMVPYKRIDMAIKVFNNLGYPLKIIGTGPDKKRLKSMAKPNIEFMGWISDEEIKHYYSGCRAFIFPQVEDFGITAVEAQAAGRPVIAFNAGGAKETVVDGVTGVFFNEPTVESLKNAVLEFEKIEKRGQKRGLSPFFRGTVPFSVPFSPEQIKQNAKRFATERFKKEIKEAISRIIK